MSVERYYVKLARGTWETVVFSSTNKAEAQAMAGEYNAQYQTDEYRVEAHDPTKAWETN